MDMNFSDGDHQTFHENAIGSTETKNYEVDMNPRVDLKVRIGVCSGYETRTLYNLLDPNYDGEVNNSHALTPDRQNKILTLLANEF